MVGFSPGGPLIVEITYEQSIPQIVMGTKCNKLLVFDVNSQQVGIIPMLESSGQYTTADPPCGIHAISVNPSR